MKNTTTIILILLVSFFMYSCEKTEDEKSLNCEFVEENCEIKIFCAWPPEVNTPIGLPVAFYYNGAQVSHEDFIIEWSSNPSFGAGAISLRYSDLPVTVKVIEKATDCVVQLTLSV